MLKLGVVSQRGVRRPRTFFGRRRYVSFLLLPELYRNPQVSPEEYDWLVGHACMPNGVWKLTRRGRLRTVDGAVTDILRDRYTAGTALVVCDLAASTGVTSVEFFRTLKEHFDVRFIASDFYRDLVAVCSRQWPVAIVFDRFGHEVQYILSRFVLPESPAESVAYPINRALKAVLRRRFTPVARAALDKVVLGRLGPFESVDIDGYVVAKLPVLTRDTLAAIGARDGFTFEDWDILKPLPERAHVIRAMNILTRDHFPDEQRACAVRNCVEALLPGGLFIVGASPTPESTTVQASIYSVQNGQLVRLTSLNGGSEIDTIVARTYQVVEAASGLSERVKYQHSRDAGVSDPARPRPDYRCFPIYVTDSRGKLNNGTPPMTQGRTQAHAEEAHLSQAPDTPRERKRLAYFINCFPNFIEAMIYREVMALRGRGYELITFSIRRPREANVPTEAAPLVDSTIYILPVRPWAFVWAHVRALACSPLTYVRTLAEVVSGTHERSRDRFRSLCHFAEAIVVLPQVKSLRIEHLHAHWAVGAATCAMVVSRFLDIPFTFTAHAYDIWRERLLLPEKLRAADMVVTCTDYNRRHLIDIYGAPAEKFRVVYHGVDLKRFQRRMRPSNERPLILSVGRLVEQKGYEELLHVCADLVRKGHDFRCEIIGEGPLRQRLESLVDALGLRGVVTLPGHLVGDAVLDCYLHADLFVLLCTEASDGDRDGIPNTMIEAMAMELPVVSTRYSGVPELVEDGTTGFLADCGDRKAVVEALRLLLTRPDVRAAMGSGGRKRVIEDFATAASVAKLEQVFATDFHRTNHPAPQAEANSVGTVKR